MAGDDSAELIIGGKSRRVAMDLTKLDHKASPTEIEGEVHDQEDLNGTKDAILIIDGAGKFQVEFTTPTRFRGTLMPSES